MAYRLTGLFGMAAAVVLGSAATASLAQTALPDPTRPPSFVPGAAGETENPGGPVLQSVIVPRKGRAIAIIDGQQVRVGDQFGERRLLKASEREVVLRGPSGIETLLLTPGVEKMKTTTKQKTLPKAAAAAVRGSNL